MKVNENKIWNECDCNRVYFDCNCHTMIEDDENVYTCDTYFIYFLLFNVTLNVKYRNDMNLYLTPICS